MFTSIALLHKSPAATDRVNSVARYLVKMNASWQDDWLFPVVAVGLSNSVDDLRWVANHDDAQLQNTSKHLFVPIDTGVKQITASQLIAATVDLCKIDGLHSNNKTAFVTEVLTKVDATLRELIGGSYSSWYFNPIMTEQPKGVAVPPHASEAAEQVATASTRMDEPVVAADAVDPLQLRKWFEKAFAHDITDFGFSTTPKNPNGKYTNDRVQGKFVGFVTAIQLVASGVIVVGSK